MHLEALFFPKNKNAIALNTIVLDLRNLINTYSIENAFNKEAVMRAFINTNRVSGDVHSSGSRFQFTGSTAAGTPFEIIYKGEGKRFRITYEVNGDYPNGLLTYMISDNENEHALFNEVKEYLKACEQEQLYDIPSESTKNEEKENTSALSQQEITEVAPLSIESGRRCACPETGDQDVVDDLRDIKMYSQRARKLYEFEQEGKVGIYKCEYCGKHLFIEQSPLGNYAKVMTEESANYLVNMSDQLDVIIADMGIHAVRENILKNV